MLWPTGDVWHARSIMLLDDGAAFSSGHEGMFLVEDIPIRLGCG